MRVIKFEQKDAVGHIVLDNPPKNLIASDFSNSLKQAVHEASESDIRALLVRAEGPNFSQGGDVLDFLEKNANEFRGHPADVQFGVRLPQTVWQREEVKADVDPAFLQSSLGTTSHVCGRAGVGAKRTKP